jgi:hypothetical protein
VKTLVQTIGRERPAPPDLCYVHNFNDPGTPRALVLPAAAQWNTGGLGVLVFGVWLALNVDGYELWDGWILTAIVLWLVASGAGGRLGSELRDGSPPPDAGRARLLLAVMALASLALLVDMIFKPGA